MNHPASFPLTAVRQCLRLDSELSRLPRNTAATKQCQPASALPPHAPARTTFAGNKTDILCIVRDRKQLDAGCAPEDAHEQAMAAAAAAHRESSGGRGRSQEEVETLHRELREAQVNAKHL